MFAIWFWRLNFCKSTDRALSGWWNAGTSIYSMIVFRYTYAVFTSSRIILMSVCFGLSSRTKNQSICFRAKGLTQLLQRYYWLFTHCLFLNFSLFMRFEGHARLQTSTLKGFCSWLFWGWKLSSYAETSPWPNRRSCLRIPK